MSETAAEELDPFPKMSNAGYVQEDKFQKRHRAAFGVLICVTLTLFLLVLAGASVFGWYLTTNKDQDILLTLFQPSFGTDKENGMNEFDSDEPGRHLVTVAADVTNKRDEKSNKNYDNIETEPESITTTTTTQITTTSQQTTTIPASTTTVPPGVSDADLSRIIGQLWDATEDTRLLINRDYMLSFQGRTNVTDTDDRAPKRLFHKMNADIRGQSNVNKRFVRLLKAYSSLSGNTELDMQTISHETNKLIEELVPSPTMLLFYGFVVEHGLLQGSVSDIVNSLWFTPFRKQPEAVSANGFQRVFVGNPQGQGQRLSNWIQFYLEEKERMINYQGYISKHEMGVVKVRFSWNGHPSQTSTFFVGTSPEFDFAVYTLCWLVRKGDECAFTVQEHTMTVSVRAIIDTSGAHATQAHPVL